MSTDPEQPQSSHLEAADNVDLKKPELNTRVVRSLVLYFEHRFNRTELDEILKRTGLERGYLDDEHNWVSMAYRDRLIKAMTDYAGDDRFAYKAGCFTATKAAIGSGYSILASFSRPRVLYQKMLALAQHANRVGRFTVLELNDQSLTCMYQPISEEYWDEGPGAEFRLGQLVAWPRLCGLPDAKYEQKIITHNGRPAYHYVFRWQNPPPAFDPLWGAIAGAVVGQFGFGTLPGVSGVAMWVLLTLIGTLLGLLRMSYRRINHLKDSIHSQQDDLGLAAEKLQARFDDLYQAYVKNNALNSSLQEKVNELQEASQEIHELNEALAQKVRDLESGKQELEEANQKIKAFNATLKQQVDAQTVELREKNLNLQTQYDRLRELDQIKTQFFARINHELRTPLTLILPPLESMLSDPDQVLPRAHRQLLETMRQNAFRLLKLINSLLDLAKGGEGKLRLRYEAVDLNELLQTVVDDVRPSTERHKLSIHTRLEADLPAVWVDMEKFETVVLNLLSNAVKFTPSGGTITVTTSYVVDHVEICVSDTGRGIPAAVLPRIFDQFTNGGTEVERGYGGTGIGLSIVKELVQLHNGWVKAESEVGQGTTFTIWLPVGEATIRPEIAERRRGSTEVPLNRRRAESRNLAIGEYFTNAHEINLSEFRGLEYDRVLEPRPRVEGRPTLLIIDDNVDMLYLLTGVLHGQYNILTANNGLEGEALARTHLPDLVLSDVMMAEKDGFSLCRDLKSDPLTREIPVVLMSAKSEAAEGIEIGADDYLTKPFHLRELRARVKNQLDLRDRMLKLRKANRELEEQKAIIERISVTDALTGLYNRRYIQDHIREMFDLARRDGSQLACIMIDIDHFKRYNTLFGHAGGDDVLREVGRLLLTWFGEIGTAARYGGEEFVVILPGSNRAEARLRAEALRKAVHEVRLDRVNQQVITLSMGVAAFPEHDVEGYEQLLKLADDALYTAKIRRDCVEEAPVAEAVPLAEADPGEGALVLATGRAG